MLTLNSLSIFTNIFIYILFLVQQNHTLSQYSNYIGEFWIWLVLLSLGDDRGGRIYAQNDHNK